MLKCLKIYDLFDMKLWLLLQSLCHLKLKFIIILYF